MNSASDTPSVLPDRWAKSREDMRLVQCPACWTAAMARKSFDWECECGELMTVVDLRDVANVR